MPAGTFSQRNTPVIRSSPKHLDCRGECFLGGIKHQHTGEYKSLSFALALDAIGTNLHTSHRYRSMNKTQRTIGRVYRRQIPFTCRCLLYIPFLAFYLSPVLLLSDDFGLVNPLEEEFAASKQQVKPAAKDRITQRGRIFTDQRIPQPSNAVKQVSAEQVAPQAPAADSIWDNPQMFANGGQGSISNGQWAADNTHSSHYVNSSPNVYSAYNASYTNPYTSVYQIPNYPPNAFNANLYVNSNPYSNPNNYAHPDPYALTYYQQPHEQNLNNVYQALLIQELARRQIEETQMTAKQTEDKQNEESADKKAEAAKQAADDSWTSSKLLPVKVTSPLGETLLSGLQTMSLFNSPTGPDRGCGQPLVNKSWLDHPYSFGGFVGPLNGSKLTENIKQKHGNTGGLIFGYNMNDYWGLESRLYFSSLEFNNAAGADWSNQLTVIDAAVNYYPLGNAKWRPYFKYGFGAGRETLTLANGGGVPGGKLSDTVITMPIGIGARYWWNDRMAVQSDIMCNTVFASGIARSQSHWSFAIGLTYSFGENNKKRPVQYWPAVPSMGSKW
ncbi:MAG: porin family protein [Planctomycetaceae bacterium]|jgi:hypothetical protein|nr:porin family protein [Planctomycetaceae bacterium]